MGLNTQSAALRRQSAAITISEFRIAGAKRMRKILYTMHFRGQTSRTTDSEVLRTSGSATSCIVSTMIRPSGMESALQASDGELAFLESELRVTGPGSFQE